MDYRERYEVEVYLLKMVKMFALVLLSANSDHQFEQLPWDHFFYRDLAFYSEPYPRFRDLSHRNAVSLPGIEPVSRQPKSGILTNRPLLVIQFLNHTKGSPKKSTSNAAHL